MRSSGFWVLLLVACTAGGGVFGVSVNSVSVKGTLRCGNETAKGVRVAVYRVPAETKKLSEDQRLEQVELSPEGRFDLTTNTNGRPLAEAELKPALRFFHRCGLKEKEKAGKVRSFQLQIPDAFVSPTKASRKTFDVGTLNLELVYPGEAIIAAPKTA